jgi:hemolysin activation/secretion protein
MNDRIRSIRVGINYDFADEFQGINQALIEYSFGIDGLGSSIYNSDLKSRLDGKPDYKKLNAQLSRHQELGYFTPLLKQFSLNTALMGQYSGGGLLSSEECGIGGAQFGRAYDYSELLGDSCIAGSIELAYSLNITSIPFKYAQFYSFYDGGVVTNINALTLNDSKSKSLMSTGVGFRFGLTDHLTGSIEGDFPLTRVVANQGNKDPRVFATLSVRF